MTQNQNTDNNSFLAEKQAYLRTHVPTNNYQDFAQYCEGTVGNIDIETWQFQYMKQLVQAFLQVEREKQKQNQKTKGKNHSFHQYQTGDSKDIKAMAEQIKKQKITYVTPSSPAAYDKRQAQKVKLANKERQQKSALQFLDQMVEKQNKVNYETKKYDKSFFQSGKIWQVPAIEEISGKTTVNSPTTNKNSQNAFKSNNMPNNQDNFQQMFQTLKNTAEIKDMKKEVQKKSQMQKKQVPVTQNPYKNGRVFQEIPMDEDNQKMGKNHSQKKKKTDIKVVSVSRIKPIKVAYDGQILLKQKFKTKVACFKSFERQALSFKDLKVVIENHEVVNRFLSSDYVMYHLKVFPSNFTCKRNLQDFFKLRKQVQLIYPGIRLPYLQKIGWLQSQINPEIIAKQKKFLTYFMEDLLSHHQLRNSRILEDFLTLKDHKLIKRKFEEYQKLKKISAIQELCLLEGQVKIELSEQNRQYNEHTEHLTQKLRHFFIQTEQILVKIGQLNLLVAQYYRKLSDLTTEMSTEISDFNKKVNFKEIQFLQQTFQSIIIYSNQHMAININESSFLKEDMIPLIRYQKEDITTFTPLFGTGRQLINSYLRQKDSEGNLQSLEYLSEKLAEYKQNILQQSKNSVVLKYQCGYLQNCLVDEGFHYFQILSKRIQGLLSNVCFKKLNNLSATVNTLTALVCS